MALAFAVADAPPGEFLIFSKGKNETSKGTFIFDDAAARAVMAAYEAHGSDVMVDLEHLSLESATDSRNFDPDARGWCKLELRGGELWATDVKWTPDGVARLSEKRQRYISPAFLFDPETSRIAELLNIAITAAPATHNLQPLVAASRRQTLAVGEDQNVMTGEQFAALAEALGLGADANVEDVLATVAAMVKKIQDAANGTMPDDGAAPANDVPAAAAAAPPMVAASRLGTALRLFVRLTGKKEIGEIASEVEAWRKSHVTLEEQRAQLARERTALEGSERRRLVAELVRLGAEIPATAWADDSATKPAEPWASMAIESLRARVAKLTNARGPAAGGSSRSSGTQPAPGAGGDAGGQRVTVDGEVVELTANEVATCTQMKADLNVYAKNKLIRERARRTTQRSA